MAGIPFGSRDGAAKLARLEGPVDGSECVTLGLGGPDLGSCLWASELDDVSGMLVNDFEPLMNDAISACVLSLELRLGGLVSPFLAAVGVR